MVITTILFELMRPLAYKTIAFACKKLNEIDIPLTITVPTELFKLSVCSFFFRVSFVGVGMGAGFLNVLSMYIFACSLPVVPLYLSHLRATVQITILQSAAAYRCTCLSQLRVFVSCRCTFYGPMLL